MSPDPGFCCISIEAEDAESCAALLLECGAVGAEIVDATHLKCFVQGSPDAASAFVEGLHLPGIRTVSIDVVHDENWVARCDELWETVEAGQMRIVPVQSGSAPNLSLNEIAIVPGMGFGTGHHPTTRIALELLQHPVIARPRHALDAGTGSGILAIAVIKLYGTESIAFDIDPLAMRNARENYALNGIDSELLFTGDILATAEKPFDLISANIYAEVLVSLRPSIERRAAKGTRLILSGIREDLTPMVVAAYAEPRWRQEEAVEEGEWRGFLYVFQ